MFFAREFMSALSTNLAEMQELNRGFWVIVILERKTMSQKLGIQLMLPINFRKCASFSSDT
jgi:hypothetical protein